MSINSPAKQERIERHLMRQRGAGVRTISASFGFCFGSSAPPSSDATPIREEPPPKRRKTILSDVILATDSADATANEPKLLHAHKVPQPRKARRRLDLENEVGNTKKAHVPDANDSFFCSLGTKRQAVKRHRDAFVSVQVEQETKAAVVKPAAKDRPKRGTATVAESKVTDGFAEEALPVDKKRQDVEPEKKPKRARKAQDAVIEIIAGPGGKGAETGNTIQANGNNLVKRDARRSIGEKVAVEIPAVTGSSSVEKAETVDSEDQVPTIPTKNVSQKNKQANRGVECHTGDELSDSHGSTPQEDVEKQAHGAASTVNKNDVCKKRSRKNVANGSTTEKALADATTLKTSRQPLKETNMNLTMRSASPEKPRTHDETAPQNHVETIQKSNRSAANEHATNRPSKRRKVEIRHDHNDAKENLENDDALPEKVITEEDYGISSGLQPSKRAAVTKPEEPVQSVTTAPTARKSKKSVRTELSEPKRTSLQVAAAKDEDVDWLFEPQQSKQQPVLSQGRASSRRTSSKMRTNMPDIDLDDLLSNIASFAKTSNASSVGSALKREGKRTKTSVRQGKA